MDIFDIGNGIIGYAGTEEPTSELLKNMQDIYKAVGLFETPLPPPIGGLSQEGIPLHRIVRKSSRPEVGEYEHTYRLPLFRK